MTRQGLRRRPAGTRLALCAAITLAILPALLGCGGDDPQTIFIDLEPWGLDFSTETDPPSEPTHFMYLVERVFMTVLRFERVVDGTYTLKDSISSPTAGEFSPYTVSVGKGASGHVLFLTDTTKDAQRLLAVNPYFPRGMGWLDTILLAKTAGPGAEEKFTDIHGVAALRVDDDTYRVFLSDGSKVWVMDYGVNSRVFSYGSPAYLPITGGCGLTFRAPVGLAVDPTDAPVAGLPALYVVDQRLNALFRFSGIGGPLPPDCDGFLEVWDEGSDYFAEPRGVAVRPGATDPSEALVVAADKRQTPSENNRVSTFSWQPLTGSFQPEPLPQNFQFFPNSAPFGLAFDERGDLWATYPEAKTLAIPPGSAQ